MDAHELSEAAVHLLRRYPVVRRFDGEEETVYILREHMTLEDRALNIIMLRCEGKNRCADALEAETLDRFPQPR